MLGWELPPHHSGGLGMVCYQMCKELSKNGVDIEFILPYDGDFSTIDFMKVNPQYAERQKTISQTSVKQAGGIYDSQQFEITYASGKQETRDLHSYHDLFVNHVSKVVELATFDVVHVHDWLTMRAGIAAKRISGKPLIVHIHATEYDRSGGQYGNPLVRDIEYLGMMMADKVLAISNYVRDVLVREYRIPPQKIEVVHNSIDYDVFVNDDAPNEFAYLEEMKQHGYRVVTNIGRLTIQKNLVNLMRAIAIVVEKRPKTLFLIVGSGDQREELIELAADLGIAANVIFEPFLRGKAWRDAFRVSDLFVMPSTSEPFGITPLEAIGFGTPALISKQAGVAEVIQNVLKVDYWDIEEMATKIAGVLNSDTLRDELHSNAKQEWDNMGWSEAAKKMLNVYHQHKELV